MTEKIHSPVKRKRLVAHVLATYKTSQRRACNALGIHRSTIRYCLRRKPDEETLRMAIVGLVLLDGYYGYRMITAKLRQAGWRVNHKRVERIWREEGLKVPKKQKKRRHLWLADGSSVRLRSTHRVHVWSYDFVEGRLSNGRKFRMLKVIDEYTRECLAIVVARRLNWEDVVVCLKELFVLLGLSTYIRSDCGAEFTTPKVRHWLKRVGVTTMFIEPGSPRENGYNESFNGTLRRELLDREEFDTLLEAQVLVERWRGEYNHERPHNSLGYRPPDPEADAPFEELVVKMDLAGDLSKVKYCRHNKHSTWI